MIDENTREYLAIKVKRSLNTHAVVEVLIVLFFQCGVPVPVRLIYDMITIKRVRDCLVRFRVRIPNIEPGSPWEIGYVESVNDNMRDEL